MDANLLKIIADGGAVVIVFVIWFLSFRASQKQYEEAHKQQTQFMQLMFKNLEDDVKYKEVLTGILTRLETKLDINTKMITENFRK